jgi:hypothetical protein
MLQELTYRLDRAALVIKEPNLPDDTALPDLDHTHRGILDRTATTGREARRSSPNDHAKVSR